MDREAVGWLVRDAGLLVTRACAALDSGRSGRYRPAVD